MKSVNEIHEYGTIRYFKEGTKILHREDGPALEYANGDKYWFKEGKCHRLDGPASEWANGDKFWYKEGKRHRLDGPAYISSDGKKEYWINGKYLKDIETDEELIIKVLLE